LKKQKISMFDMVVGFFLILLCFSTIYPFIYAFLYSVSDGIRALTTNITILPAGFTLDNYKVLFADNRIIRATMVSISRTVLGTSLFILVTGLCAYAMSKQQLIGRKYIFIFFVIPMYVSGGLLPTYVLIHDMGLMDNFLVYILPGCFAMFFMILMKVYFEGIPVSLEESAKLDGAGELVIYVGIYFPLSLPIYATVALFVGVSQWNSWFDALLYMQDTKLYPLQLLLQNVLKESQMSTYTQLFEQTLNKKNRISTETLKMAILITSTLPIVFVYPFAQKYFVKGVTVGAIKM